MSIIDETLNITIGKKGEVLDPISNYKPTDEEREAIFMMKKFFTLGDTTMRKPRREFNDLSVLDRMTVDQMAWNTYQPNDGDGIEGDQINEWKSRAMKPVVRNKIVSIAAHATARVIFPKVFAYSKDNDEESDAADVMRDLMEWCADQSDYEKTSFYAIISALVNPASIINIDNVEAYRSVRKKNKKGKSELTYEKDEENSGFRDTVVSVDELYIENIYEHDIQKQGWLIWRKVQSYDLLRTKYGHLDNFKYVKPGVQLIYNNANQTFYEVYDTNMDREFGEEVILWHKGLDLKLIEVNGVLLTDHDNPNPRLDKMYPFIKFGYELIDEGKFFYYKSLAFKMKQDANIINTLYPMIIDGTYLNIFPPVKITGVDEVASDVIIPGASIALSNPDADAEAIRLGQDIRGGIETLFEVEKSINQTSQDPIMAGQQPNKGSLTAYEISKLEQNANTVLGLFIKMISFFVKSYGKLRVNDILQYLTLPDATEIVGNEPLVYKSFLLPDKNVNGKNMSRKIQFDGNMSDQPQSGMDQMTQSYNIKAQEEKEGIQLYKVNPRLIRNLKFDLKVSPDVLQPTSEDLERAFALEQYDRLIKNPLANQQEALKMLLAAYPKTRGDIEKYIGSQTPGAFPGMSSNLGNLSKTINLAGNENTGLAAIANRG